MVDTDVYLSWLESYMWECAEKTLMFSGSWRYHSMPGTNIDGVTFFFFKYSVS